MDNSIKNIKKIWVNSLSFLDNSVINSIIVIILILYSSGIFENINTLIANIYEFSLIRLFILLLIVYLAPKDITIAILLALSYVISVHYMKRKDYFSNLKENFFNFNKVEDSNPIFKQPVLPSQDESSSEIDNRLPNKACMQMYEPKFQEVSNVCSPVATYKDEFNAQGLNFPEGFNSPNVGAPL